MSDAETSPEQAPEVAPSIVDAPGCGFFFGWLLATVLGAGVGWAAAWWISFRVAGAFSIVILGAVMGLSIGVFQQILLHGRFPSARWWALVSAAGWAVGFPGGVQIAHTFGQVEAVFGTIVGAAVGAAVGFAQWFVMRRLAPGTGWWVPITVFAWASSLLFYRPGVSAIGLYYGVLVGLVTGIAMLWYLFRPESSDFPI